MNNYKNACTEVHTILQYLNEEEYHKIPQEVLDAIASNRNTEYIYEMNEDVDLTKQEMMTETKAILFNLFRDYLSTIEQKEKIIKMQQEEQTKNELEKQKLYNSDVFTKNKQVISKQNGEENLALVQNKESIFKKIITKLKNFFR